MGRSLLSHAPYIRRVRRRRRRSEPYVDGTGSTRTRLPCDTGVRVSLGPFLSLFRITQQLVSACQFFFRYSVGRNIGITSRGQWRQPAPLLPCGLARVGDLLSETRLPSEERASHLFLPYSLSLGYIRAASTIRDIQRLRAYVVDNNLGADHSRLELFGRRQEIAAIFLG